MWSIERIDYPPQILTQFTHHHFNNFLLTVSIILINIQICKVLLTEVLNQPWRQVSIAILYPNLDSQDQIFKVEFYFLYTLSLYILVPGSFSNK